MEDQESSDPQFEDYFPGLLSKLEKVPEFIETAKGGGFGASTHDVYPLVYEEIFEPCL